MANMMLEINWSSVISTFPTATPMHKTFFNWNLMVDLTSVILALKSSLWETGVGNLPAVRSLAEFRTSRTAKLHTLGETGTQKTRNLLDESIGSNEGIVLASKLLDELLVLVQLFQVISRHGVDTTMLGTIDIVLITKNTVHQISLVQQVSIEFVW